MKTSSTLQKYYITEQERLRQLIQEECRTDVQRAAVSVMALERCALQLALLAEQVPELAGLSFYATIAYDSKAAAPDLKRVGTRPRRCAVRCFGGHRRGKAPAAAAGVSPAGHYGGMMGREHSVGSKPAPTFSLYS